MRLSTESSSSRIRVSRTSSTNDAELSPFILDPTSVALDEQISSNHYNGKFLQTPVSIRITRSRLSALRLMHYMESLTHPNLEQLLGVVVDERIAQSMLVTSKSTGKSVADILSESDDNKSLINKDTMVAIGVQACRALIYLHSSTGGGHPGLCPHAVIFDSHRSKTVVLLALRCRECRPDLRTPSTGGDVKILASMILDMAQSGRTSTSNGLQLSSIALKSLKQCVQTEKQDKLSMRKLCEVLSYKA